MKRAPTHPDQVREKPTRGRPPAPSTWPKPYTSQAGRVVQDSMCSAGLAVQASAAHFVRQIKKTKTDAPELVLLRDAVARMRAFHVPDAGGFPPKYVRVLGIDSGYANIGVMAVDFTTEFLRCAHAEKITTDTADGTADERLALVAQRFHLLFAQLRPDVVAFENVGHVGFGIGDKNADSMRMIEVTGMIRMCCQLFACMPCYAVATASARKEIFGHTPRGTTRSKQNVVDRVAELLGLRLKPSQDVAEAGAVAFGGFAKHMEAVRAGRAELRK